MTPPVDAAAVARNVAAVRDRIARAGGDGRVRLIAVTKGFGVPVNGGQYAARHTFLIGADGKIKKIWREVNTKEHAKELLDAAGVSSAPAAEAPAKKAG